MGVFSTGHKVSFKKSYGVIQEVIWGHPGVDLGLFRESFGAIQGVIWGHPEGHSGSLWGSFGIIQGVIWDHLGDPLGSSRGVKNPNKKQSKKTFSTVFQNFLFKRLLNINALYNPRIWRVSKNINAGNCIAGSNVYAE